MLHYYHGDFTDKRTIIGIKMAHQCFLHKCSQHLRADPSIFSPLVSLTVVYWWHAPTKVSQQFWVGSSGLYNTSKLCFAWNALWSSSKLNITYKPSKVCIQEVDSRTDWSAWSHFCFSATQLWHWRWRLILHAVPVCLWLIYHIPTQNNNIY